MVSDDSNMVSGDGDMVSDDTWYLVMEKNSL